MTAMPPSPHRPKPTAPARSTKRLPAAPDPKPARNAVNYVLDDRQHARILSELIRVKEAAGMQVKLGAYAKNALLEHARLRAIEGKVRALLQYVQAANPKDDPCPDLAATLRAILDTPVAG